MNLIIYGNGRSYQMDLHSCSMEFTHIVHRECTIKWELAGKNDVPNLILVYDGSAYVEHNNATGQIVKKGDLVYFPGTCIRKGHTFAADLMKCYAICVKLTQIQEDGQIASIDLPIDFVQNINDPYKFNLLKRYFENMVSFWESDDCFKNYELNAQFMLILKELLKWQQKKDYNYVVTNHVRNVMEYMKMHLNEKLEVGHLSEQIGVSTSYLSRIFKEVTGETLISHFNRLKIEKSKYCLEAGASISDCANEVGISDIYYFSKLFKQYESIAPSYYLKNRI